jgi:hypothetical protein
MCCIVYGDIPYRHVLTGRARRRQMCTAVTTTQQATVNSTAVAVAP